MKFNSVLLSSFSSGTGNLINGDTLTISFLGTTDLNNISTSDIFSYKYNLASGPVRHRTTGTNYYGSGWGQDAGDLADHFNWNGHSLDLTFDNTLGANGEGDLISQYDDLGNYSQIVGASRWQLYTTFNNNTEIMYAGVFTEKLTLTAESVSNVPIPAAVWLMGSGLLGLLGFSRKNKSQVVAS